MGTDYTIFNHMAKYDFTAPIDVEYFEENDEGIQNTNKTYDGDVIFVSELKTNESENHGNNTNALQTNNTREPNKNINCDTTNEINSEKDVPQCNLVVTDKTSVPTIQDTEHVQMTNSFLSNPIDSMGTKTTDPLNIVSECLLFITDSYGSHLKIRYDKQSTPSMIEQSMNHYLRIKNHFFKICYDIVITKIVPQENNYAFIQTFLNKTLPSTISKNDNYKTLYLKAIFREMIYWAKYRKYLIDSYRKNNPSVLVQQLNSPPMTANFRSLSTIQPQQTNTTGPNLRSSCIFTSGPPGREVSINVIQGTFSNKNAQLVPTNTLSTNNGTNTDYQSQYTLNNFRTSNRLEHTEGMASGNYQSNSHVNTTNTLIRGAPPDYYSAINRNNPRNMYLNVGTIMEKNIYNDRGIIRRHDRFNETPQKSPDCNNSSFVVQYPAKRARHSSLYSDVRPINMDNVLENNARLRNVQTAPPRYEMNFQYTQTQNSNSINGIQYEYQHNVSSNSAGVVNNEISKSNCNTTESRVNTLLNLEEQTENLYVDKEKCCVCKSLTKTKCSICYNVYYCSLDCQRSHWTSHESSCQK